MDGHHSHFNVSSQPGSGSNLQQHFVPNPIPQYVTDINSIDPNNVSLPVMDSVDMSSQYYQTQRQQQLQFQFDPNTDYYYNPQTGQTFSIARPQAQIQFQQQQQQQQELQSQNQGPAIMFMQPQRIAYEANQQPVTMQMQPQISQSQLLEQQLQHHVPTQSILTHQQSLSSSQGIPQNTQDGLYSQHQSMIQMPMQPSLKPNNTNDMDNTNNTNYQENHSSKRIKLDTAASDVEQTGMDVDMSLNPSDTLTVTDTSNPLVKPNQPVAGLGNITESNINNSIVRDFQPTYNHSQGHMHYHESSVRSGSVSTVRFEYEDPHSFAPPNSEELIKNAGQMLMVGIGSGDDEGTPMEQIKELITKYGVGNIILPSRYMKGLCLL